MAQPMIFPSLFPNSGSHEPGSLPSTPTAPNVIRIKRKREDAPLDSLYVDRRKRRATDYSYVFRRLDTVSPLNEGEGLKQEYDELGVPKVRRSEVGEERRDPFALGRGKRGLSKVAPVREGRLGMGGSVDGEGERRREFRLSKIGVEGQRFATFVERRRGRRAGSAGSKLEGARAEAGGGVVEEGEGGVKRKKPTPNARHRAKPCLSVAGSETQVNDDMAEKMHVWSQQEAGSTDPPEPVSAPDEGADAMDVDMDEGDYVYDTYYRHPLPLNAAPDPGISFGHLVIAEDEEELWEGYLEGEGSESEKLDTDDEDSNAEDYYGADYPEDEVASDDEFGRDVYQYHREAGELEDFDEKLDGLDEQRRDGEDGTAAVRSDDEEPRDKSYRGLLEAREWKRREKVRQSGRMVG